MKQTLTLCALIAAAPIAMHAQTITLDMVKKAGKPAIAWVQKNKITAIAATITAIYATKKIVQSNAAQKMITYLKLNTGIYPQKKLSTPRQTAGKTPIPNTPNKSFPKGI